MHQGTARVVNEPAVQQGSATTLCASKQLPREPRFHILRAYPYDSNGAFALVVDVCLDAVDGINDVAVDAGLLAIEPEGSRACSGCALCVIYMKSWLFDFSTLTSITSQTVKQHFM